MAFSTFSPHTNRCTVENTNRAPCNTVTVSNRTKLVQLYEQTISVRSYTRNTRHLERRRRLNVNTICLPRRRRSFGLIRKSPGGALVLHTFRGSSIDALTVISIRKFITR